MQVSDAIAVPMRDGVRLSALLVRPVETAKPQKLPTILIKTPYTAAMELQSSDGKPWLDGTVVSRLLKQGYALAVVNDRGTGWSEGEFHPQKEAGNDGYDTLSWIAAQPWSDGKVGTLGCSSSAENQWALSKLNHPAHKAMVLMSATAGVGSIPGYHGQGLHYIGGVPPLPYVWWYLEYGNIHHPQLPAGISQEERSRLAAVHSAQARVPMTQAELAALGDHLPSQDILRAANAPATDFDHLITLAPAAAEWSDYGFLREGDSTRVPGLHIDSWYTFQAYGTLRAFEYLSGNSPDQHLVMGPTAHCGMGSETQQTMVGDRDVGDARFDYASMIVDWFNHWLKDEKNASADLPKVRYYPLSSNHWRTSATWPLPGTKEYKLYLGSAGSANSVFGNGRLDGQARHSGAAYDQFAADPLHPVPSRGGSCCDADAAKDQSSIEARNDVLVYTTDPLAKDLDLAGYITAKLYLSSSARDTDLMLKLVDVYPDGRAFNVVDSARRVRYRDGYGAPKLMSPGQVYPVLVDEMVIASHIPPGHRIRIEISGSNFPNYERNLNTGGNNFDESRPVIAIDRIYHDSSHESFVSLPVSDGGT